MKIITRISKFGSKRERIHAEIPKEHRDKLKVGDYVKIEKVKL